MTDAADPIDDGHRRRYRVRFDEAGPDGLLRTSALLRYAQDVAWVHSDALGFDRDWYRRRRLAWLVRAAELEVLEPIPMGAEVEVGTAVVGYRRVWARRRAEVRLSDGRLAARVETDWLMVDARGVVVRIPADFGVAFPTAAANAGPIARVALPVAPAEATSATIRVRPHDLDPNDHANNATYLDWLEEAVLEVDGPLGDRAIRARPRRYRLEYAAAAGPAEVLRAATWRAGSTWFHRLVGPDGADVVRARLDV